MSVLLVRVASASILHGGLAIGYRAILDAGVWVVSLAASSAQVVILKQVARTDAFVECGERGVAVDVLLLQFAHEHAL